MLNIGSTILLCDDSDYNDYNYYKDNNDYSDYSDNDFDLDLD